MHFGAGGRLSEYCPRLDPVLIAHRKFDVSQLNHMLHIQFLYSSCSTAGRRARFDGQGASSLARCPVTRGRRAWLPTRSACPFL